MTDKIRLIIADDHPIVRQGLRELIEREPDLKVIAECGNGLEALKILSEQPVDIAIIDIDMPEMDGFEVLRTLAERAISRRVILLTVHRDEIYFQEALRLSVEGYVLKDSAVEDIVKAIRTVSAGENYASPALTTYLFKLRKNHDSPLFSQRGSLTETEREVLKLIAEYKTTNEIADKLCISPLTVKTHRRNISLKFNLQGHAALTRFAIDRKSML